ncbi:AIPR family protein [Sphingorhabdus contaminans]|uniref:AIPR family protein n=1 Tax=Sphingorhabdus contaminans TaxID=1343899 RepID=UPI003D276E2F
MSAISKMDWDIIDARVKNARVRHNLTTDSMALLAITLEQICPGTENNLGEIITDGSDDRGIDAIHFIESENDAEIYLFQSKYRESQNTANKTINDNDILKISLFLTDLFEKSSSLALCHNFRLNEAVNRIWQMHEDGKICRYRVIFCSNGGGFAISAKNIIDTLEQNHPSVQFEFYGAQNIISGMALEGRKQESGSLQVIGKEILERSDGDVRGVIASVDARSFIKLITTEDGYTIKRNLFDDNLRIFLGSKGGYNTSIINTATSSDSYLFWYLNNGITITCRNFSYNKGHSNPVLNFEDFQIVNGAQTSHSLVEAARTNSESIGDVVLMVRIYATDRIDISDRVAVATNSQARIQSRDLKSNHESMKKLELAFRERGYFFERKRGMHSDKEESKRIDALKLGQIILSFELNEPDKARTESDSIFDSRFNQIFHDKWNIDKLVRIFELYRIIETLRDSYQTNHGESPESGTEHRYLVYGHWFVLFACKLLLVRETGKEIPFGQDAEELIEEAIRRVAAACGQTKAVAHYQMFRSPRTRDKILGEISAKQIDFFELFASI